MLPISPDEVTEMSIVVESTMPEAIQVIDVEQISNGAGGARELEHELGYVNGNVSKMTSSEREVAKSLGISKAAVILVPRDTAITSANRLRFKGTTYDIKSVPGPETWETGIRVLVETVEVVRPAPTE